MIYAAIVPQTGTFTFTNSVVTTGDTAMVMEFLFTPLNDTIYTDTFVLGGSGADSVAVTWTAPATATDSGMCADSMAAYVNASACSTYVTATVTDTSLMITSVDPGVAFVVYYGDGKTDTGTVVENATSYSSIRDTFGIPTKPEQALWGWVVLEASPNTQQGYGLADSGLLWLYATSAGERHLLDSSIKASLPCSLRVSHPDAAGSDTLFKEGLVIDAYVTDSTSDTTMSAIHKLIWYLIPR